MYTLTEIDLPEGWRPAADSNNVAAGWVAIERIENKRGVEDAIYRAADGAILDLKRWPDRQPRSDRRGP